MLTRTPFRLRSGRLVAVVLVAVVLVAVACGVTQPPAPTPIRSAGGTAPPATTLQSAGPPASAQLLAIDDLPIVELDPETLTAICDPYPNQLDPDAGEATLFCHDSIVLGIRALRTATDQPVLRAYLIRPGCPPVPCTPESLHKGTLAAWVDGGAYAVLLDSRGTNLSVPEPIGGNNWPSGSALSSPPIGRENIFPAPPEVAARTPLPSCGRAGFDASGPILACFRNSVLRGAQAEVIRESPGEFGPVINIVRFEGAGAVTRYQLAEGHWVVQRGSLVLGPGDDAWDFEPWDAGVEFD